MQLQKSCRLKVVLFHLKLEPRRRINENLCCGKWSSMHIMIFRILGNYPTIGCRYTCIPHNLSLQTKSLHVNIASHMATLTRTFMFTRSSCWFPETPLCTGDFLHLCLCCIVALLPLLLFSLINLVSLCDFQCQRSAIANGLKQKLLSSQFCRCFLLFSVVLNESTRFSRWVRN